ncbi:MAG: hypothetical protein H6553_11185 [Chitinophagales bacterium]|nr:hypothetical protein [Chitinophagales bacterium]
MLTKNNTDNGLITLVATVTLCGQNYTAIKYINSGLPFFDEPTHAIPSFIDCDGATNFQCYTSGPDGTVKWYAARPLNHTNTSWTKVWSVPSTGSGIIWSGNSAPNNTLNAVDVHFRANNRQITLKTTASNACGSAVQYYCFATNNTACPPSGYALMSDCNNFEVSLQTMSKQVQIQQSSNSLCNTESESLQLNSIQIIDKLGNVVNEQKVDNVQKLYNIDLSMAKNDIYFVLLQYDNYVETHQIAMFK